jgi:hypothetical protein
VPVDRARFARHLMLAEVGEEGQARLCAASATLAVGGRGPLATEVALLYLARAGVENVARSDEAADPEPWVVIELRAPGAREVADGSLAALAAIRDALGLRGPA